MTQEPAATVRVELESRPECLTLVRGMLAGVGDSLRFDPELLDDLKTAVSEACNNVVLHAYGDQPGPLTVVLQIDPDAVSVTVRDRGGGIQSVTASEDRMGVGLAVISALADRAEFVTAADGGTEVRMAFIGRGGVKPAQARRDGRESAPTPQERVNGDVIVTLSPLELLPGVLGRVARALAAEARFSLDRFSDLYLVTDAIAAHACSAAAGPWMAFAIAVANRRLELTVAPFTAGSSAALKPSADSASSRSPLAVLANELSVESHDGSELLRVVLLDPRKPAS